MAIIWIFPIDGSGYFPLVAARKRVNQEYRLFQLAIADLAPKLRRRVERPISPLHQSVLNIPTISLTTSPAIFSSVTNEK